MKDLAFDLLRTWCDRLLSLQIHEIDDERLAGGILCPACHRLHGRSADALPALLYLHKRTGEDRYLTAAKNLFYWSERNMRRSDGGMHNDSNLSWNGITVFSTISLGESIEELGESIDDAQFLADLKTAMRKGADFVCAERFMNPLPQINYIASSPAALEYAHRIFGDDAYHSEAQRRFDLVFSQFLTKKSIVFGEIHPPAKQTERGCVAVDMGYNLEESYPNLALYAKLTGNPEAKRDVARLLDTALPFLLPDGGLDNSWGCRSDKWTYYGSRTSDGMLGGLAMLADLSPAFAEAARRNLLVMKRCTVDGLLAGGVMYGDSHEPICTHHALTHCRSLTAYLLENASATPTSLPCDKADGDGVSHYGESGVLRVNRGGWIASIADSDLPPKTPGKTAGYGGALTMLYHREAGVVSAGSMTKYALSEPNNMQYPRHQEVHTCTTPRIVRGAFSNVFDLHARVDFEDRENETTVSVRGVLSDIEGKTDLPYRLTYVFSEGRVCITVDAPDDAEFYFFAVSDADAPISVGEHDFVFRRADKHFCLRTDGALTHTEPRLFTTCGGFLSFPVRIQKPKQIEIHLL